jgi:membrane dipeptidase
VPLRTALKLAVVTLTLAAPVFGQTPQDRSDAVAHARALMTETPLIDGHNDLPWQVRDHAAGDFSQIDIAGLQEELHTDIPRLRQGLIGGAFFVAYVPANLIANGATRFGLMQIDLIHRMVDRYPDTFAFATTADEVLAAFDSGRIAVLIGLEGGHAIEGSLDVLRTFNDLGVRYMTLTHWRTHAWADAATDEPRHQGLSEFGESVIHEMNRLGILIDLSHVSDETMMDALRLSEAPVIYSHSSARALTDHVRNVPDSILRQLADNGGIVMVNYAPSYVSDEVRLYEEAENDDSPAPRATLAQVADHFDHLISVAGIDHVGFGSDFDGIDTTPVGLEDVSTFPAIVAELVRRGYTDTEIKKLLGLNLLRVLRDAEATASRLQAEEDPKVATISPEIDEPEQR